MVSSQDSHRHIALLRETAAIGEAKRWYDRSRKCFSLLVSLPLETPDPAPASHTSLLGVDVGQRSLATVATLDNGAQFYAGPT
jgi:putative transposase